MSDTNDQQPHPAKRGLHKYKNIRLNQNESGQPETTPPAGPSAGQPQSAVPQYGFPGQPAAPAYPPYTPQSQAPHAQQAPVPQAQGQQPASHMQPAPYPSQPQKAQQQPTQGRQQPFDDRPPSLQSLQSAFGNSQQPQRPSGNPQQPQSPFGNSQPPAYQPQHPSGNPQQSQSPFSNSQQPAHQSSFGNAQPPAPQQGRPPIQQQQQQHSLHGTSFAGEQPPAGTQSARDAFWQLPPQQSTPPSPSHAGGQTQSPATPAQQQPGRGPNVPLWDWAEQQPPIASAVNYIRGFTDKLATVVGHTVEPPAPIMERYRPQKPTVASVIASSGGGAGGSGGSTPPPKQPGTFSQPRRPLPVKIAKRRQRRKNSRPIAAMIILFTVLGLLLSVIFGGGAYGYTVYQQQYPQIQKYAKQQIPQMTRIFDRNNVLLAEVYTNTPAIGGRRVNVEYNDIPQIMQDAMTSIEDRTFWTNGGYDLTSIVRAASSGVGGGSTITQQLVKNLTGNKDATLDRKINEAAMSIALTQQYSKSTILTMYLNTVPFGSQDYGIETAAEDYFGLQAQCQPNQPCTPGISRLNYNSQTKKDDPVLGLARASLLAGIPNEPYTYDPTLNATHEKAALQRQDTVLKAMQSNNVLVGGKPITSAMIKEAEALTAKMTFKPVNNIKRAPNFVDYVITQVETALGDGDPNKGVEQFITGGYNIRTTIDVNLNDYAQNAVTRHLYQPEIQKGTEASCGQPVTLADDTNGYYCDGTAMPANVHNAAVVVQDVKNGEILAMVGSANYNSTDPTVSGMYNAALSPRQPGSTFKIFDYATAFEMGWNPGITLADTMTSFPNGAGAGTSVPTTTTQATDDADSYPGIYTPSDYGAKWWNFIESVTWATANSMNVPAIRAMQYAGPAAVKATAERLGLTFSSNQTFGLAAAIGAADVSPLQMVNAYATFGNGGVRVQPQTVLDIWDNNGNSLYHYDESHPQSTRVVSPQVAYEMTSVLADEPARNFEFIGDHDLSFADIDPSCATSAVCDVQLAAKTGTTDNFTDNWTIGYTPNVAVAVWVGNSNNAPLVNSIGITGAAPIFHSVIERTLGWCNYSTSTLDNPSDTYAQADQVPCGSGGKYSFSFSGHPQLKFTNPGGVTIGIPSGLSGSGSTDTYTSLTNGDSARKDWMLSN